MTKKLILSPIAFFVMAILAFSFMITPAFADHDHDDHNDEAHMHDDDMDAERAQMLALIEVLQQLVVLLAQQAGADVDMDMMEMDKEDDHDHDEHDHDDHAHDHHADSSDGLKVWIEVHDGATHVHIQEPGEEFMTFFLDDIAYTDEDAVIDAIAAYEGISSTVEEITEVIVFPAESDEEITDTDEYTGIHIMGNGDVMLGNGEVLETATVDEDGMIVLEDGTVLEPAFDLR